jgi:hypothetical protein
VRDGAAHALVAASRRAELLVLAARRRPPGPGPRLGPVTRTVLTHAYCPVLVVPVQGAAPRARFHRSAGTTLRGVRNTSAAAR